MTNSRQQNLLEQTQASSYVTPRQVNPDLVKPQFSSRVLPELHIVLKLMLVFIILTLISSFFVIVPAGGRGVLMRFGAVQSQVLEEGIHPVIPIVHTVQTLSIRVQKQEISAAASSKDLQDIYIDVVLNWHIIPDEASILFQRIGDEPAVVSSVVSPAVEEVLKAVVAMYTAEEIVTQRGDVKAQVDQSLTTRLRAYHVAVDDVSLVHIRFSKRFSDAVEAKQVAEQEAKRAEFIAQKAVREAEAKVNLAKGEAEAYQVVQSSLTPEILQQQAIQRWNGDLPVILGNDSRAILDLNKLLQVK